MVETANAADGAAELPTSVDQPRRERDPARRRVGARLVSGSEAIPVQCYAYMRDVLSRLYRTKTLLIAVITAVLGVALVAVGNRVTRSGSSGLLSYLPVSEVGGTLLGASVFGIWLDHFMRREQQAVEEQRLRALLHEQAPAMRDAVLEAWSHQGHHAMPMGPGQAGLPMSDELVERVKAFNARMTSTPAVGEEGTFAATILALGDDDASEAARELLDIGSHIESELHDQ